MVIKNDRGGGEGKGDQGECQDTCSFLFMIIRILPCLYRPLSVSNSGFKHHSFSVGTGVKYFLLIRTSEFKGAMGVTLFV